MLAPMGFEPITLGLWHLLCLHSHALKTELTWQELIEGYLTSLVLAQLAFGLRWFRLKSIKHNYIRIFEVSVLPANAKLAQLSLCTKCCNGVSARRMQNSLFPLLAMIANSLSNHLHGHEFMGEAFQWDAYWPHRNKVEQWTSIRGADCEQTDSCGYLLFSNWNAMFDDNCQ